MKVLAIETSCDETAISLLDAQKKKGGFLFKVLGNALLSQTELHAKYGGVFPMMAKREHSRNLVPLFKDVMAQGLGISSARGGSFTGGKQFSVPQLKKIQKTLVKEPDLLEQFLIEIPKIKKPNIDRIAVTSGPGLEPALWVGINFAKALSIYWDTPLVCVNHMEGHFVSSLLSDTADLRRPHADKRIKNSLNAIRYTLSPMKFPLLALLISGGHTELVLSKKWQNYKIIGATRDDAVGEAFDKVARMMGLPYPGGPQISALAESAQTNADLTRTYTDQIQLPRPMLHSNNFDFSFSGLKTAVLYLIRDLEKNHSNILKNVGMKKRLTIPYASVLQNTSIRNEIAREFEDAVVEVLVTKTLRALEKFKARTLLIGGGVSANERIRQEFTNQIKTRFPNVKLFLPDKQLTTDNAIMIGLAGYFKKTSKTKMARVLSSIRADGNLKLGD